MQVHQEFRAAPALALAGKRWNKKECKLMHLIHAPLKRNNNRENDIKKPAFTVPV
ncbi:hypothetical protein [Enterobacter hormaechei]|uniref:hypothetical protein n=1 Tax=Enterobacter hormaechei TaxID=158836 RepID=UPI002FEF7814